MWALIHGGKVVDLADSPFDVAPPLHWVECGPDVEHGWTWDGEKLAAPMTSQPDYAFLRCDDYGSIPDQLDMIYWDAVNGTPTWRDHIAEVKARHPKA